MSVVRGRGEGGGSLSLLLLQAKGFLKYNASDKKTDDYTILTCCMYSYPLSLACSEVCNECIVNGVHYTVL